MATCDRCGKEMRDDDWTCGNCGAPVANAGASTCAGGGATGSAPSYSSPAAYVAPFDSYGAAAAAKSGLSRTTLTVILVAAVALVAVIAVWFFVVRGTGGTSPFLGTWNESAGGAGTVKITMKSGGFAVTMTGKDATGAEKAYTIPAHLAGGGLEVTVDDFVNASGNEEQAAQAKAVFEAIIRDFRLVFTLRDPTHLEMSVAGTPVGGSMAGQASSSSTVLVKDD
jgi:hypothetical protein